MEPALAVIVGVLAAASVFLLLSRNIVRMLLGIAVLSNAVNLTILTAGRLTRFTPPIIPEGETALSTAAANPLPQALILTAIVISFSLFAFMLVLVRCAYSSSGTDVHAQMQETEQPDAEDDSVETLRSPSVRLPHSAPAATMGDNSRGADA